MGFYLSSLYFDEDGFEKVFYFFNKSVTKLKRGDMLTTSDVAKVYDTILSIPGMNEAVKIDMRISRKKCTAVEQCDKAGPNRAK